MRFNIYGRFQLEVRRENDSWEVYRLGPGKRMKEDDLFIPPTLETEEIGTFLDDIYHELAGPGQDVKLLS
ncbi:hypothetical protein HH212_09030 [Massilia forsythiae]|uniref:DUF7661 domain-containing protein n=1 Tax=Massilia forsythiae TaxID=2728020 RepID=A0A7Z2VVZ5_9BURK|nr:hypothetical protein [Massilia forsythiae]QJE00150.1 hypothetical protein HH212_09030 [Massilia forsythiae]